MPLSPKSVNDSLLWYLKRFSTGLFKPVPFSSMPHGVVVGVVGGLRIFGVEDWNL